MIIKTISGILAIATVLILTNTTINQSSKINTNKPTITQYSPNVTVVPTNNQSTIKSNIDIELFVLYLDDIEKQTNRKISLEQKNLLVNWVSNNNIHNLDKSITDKHRKEFNKNKKKLLTEWGEHYNTKWTKYTENVISEKTGEILRRKGNNYEAHHIIELDYGGVNEWWNLHPARFPDAHQNGIHRKGSVGDKLFSE